MKGARMAQRLLEVSAMEHATSGSERRRFNRVPPLECRLRLKPCGLAGWLSPNLAVQWLDVSEGGIGVLASRPLEPGRELLACISAPGYSHAFQVRLVVRHARPSSRTGCWVIGFEFLHPSMIMRLCIRSLVDTGSLPPRNIVAAYERVG